MTAVVTWVRCFHCNAEQTVIGPSIDPTMEFPGWRLDPLAFYTPGGRHQCARHRRKAWQAYCCDLVSIPADDIYECEPCLATGGVFVDAPADLWQPDEVVGSLNEAGLRCAGGRVFFDVESVGEASYFWVQPEVRIWL